MRFEQDPPQPTNGRHSPDPHFTGSGSASHETDDVEQEERTIPDDLKLLLQQFRELGEYFSYYVTAKTDSVKLALRNVVLCVVLAALGFVAVGGLIVSASWLMLSGIAEGLGGLFDSRPWLGSLLTGLLLFAGLGLGMYCTVAQWKRVGRERTAQKYERRQAQQQAQFGQNVADQAAATTSQKK